MIDFKRLANGDIDLSNGDISYGNMTAWHKYDILVTKPGDLKHAPGIGVNIFTHLNDDNPEALLRKIRDNYKRDGIKVISLRVEQGQLIERSFYE